MSAYYQLLDRVITEDTVTSHYRPTLHTQGAWNAHEQHMAAASGVLAAELEQFQPRSDLRIGRISFDIFGLIALNDFSISSQVIRAGKTIELIEAVMRANNKICIVARAWRMCTQNSQSVAGLEDQSIHRPEDYQPWTGIKRWPYGFIESLEARTNSDRRAGKGIVWLNNSLAMVEDQPTSDFVHLMGMVDTANGVVARQDEAFTWGFPNLDLQIHLYRAPTGQWLGLETVQQYGADGIGLTSSILHDSHGPFGRSEQILTLRKLD